MSRLRVFTILLAIFAMVVTLAACGGSDSSDTTGGGDTGAGTEDPQTVLDQAFDPNSSIKTADIDLEFNFESTGSSEADLTASLTGPVDGTDSKAPKFALTAKLDGSGGGEDLTFDGGATSTGDDFYVSYNGTDYQLDDQTASFLKQAFASGASQQTQQSGSLEAFKDVLTNLSNEGTEDVEGTESTHISGDVDVKKLVDAIRPLAEQAQSLGSSVPGAGIPSPAELDQVTKLIQSATFDVYAGTEDHALRRLTATVDLDDPSSDDTAKIDFDLTLKGVNEQQDIAAPANPEPIDQLIPGGLGSLLGGSLGSSTGSAAAVPAVPGISAAQSQCLANATSSAQISACLK